MTDDALEFRKVKALEDISDYLRRIDGMMQVMAQTLDDIKENTNP